MEKLLSHYHEVSWQGICFVLICDKGLYNFFASWHWTSWVKLVVILLVIAGLVTVGIVFKATIFKKYLPKVLVCIPEARMCTRTRTRNARGTFSVTCMHTLHSDCRRTQCACNAHYTLLTVLRLLVPQTEIKHLGVWGAFIFIGIYAVATVFFVPGSVLTLSTFSHFHTPYIHTYTLSHIAHMHQSVLPLSFLLSLSPPHFLPVVSRFLPLFSPPSSSLSSFSSYRRGIHLPLVLGHINCVDWCHYRGNSRFPYGENTHERLCGKKGKRPKFC